MPDIPRTKFNSPWTVAVIEAALNDVSSAKGSSESLTAALNAMRAEINSLSGGVHLKGAVDYYNNLPASPSEGDAYTVRYQGTSGTDPLGVEYAWATYQGTPQWIPIGVDPSVFAKATDEADDRAALVELVDGGGKNLCPNNAETSTVPASFTDDFAVNIPAGTYVVSIICDVQQSFALSFYRALPHSGNTIKNIVFDAVEQGARQIKTVTIAEDAKYCAFYFNVAGEKLTDIMICTPAAWKISQSFQPYRPSWQEMYDMILALQSGGNRALTMQPTESAEPEESEAR